MQRVDQDDTGTSNTPALDPAAQILLEILPKFALTTWITFSSSQNKFTFFPSHPMTFLLCSARVCVNINNSDAKLVHNMVTV